MAGFFSLTEITGRVPLVSLPQCGKCGLHETCLTKKMKPSGKGRRGILIIGEAPEEEEDRQGRQFVGKTGRRLESVLARAGVRMREDCWLTNALICRPPDNFIKDERAVDYCRPNALAAVKEFDPTVILLVGKMAVRSVLGHLWKEDVGSLGRWVGWRIPSQELNAWVCPVYHPSHVEREENRVLDLVWEQQLRAACNIKSRPWDAVPDYGKQVKVIYSPQDATRAVRGFTERGHPVSFDYETDRLKPDHADAAIVSCAVSDGVETVAYPWHGVAVEATRELLHSRVPKWGYNQKFEERWTAAAFGRGVRNWKEDGMLLAHVLDNRAGICSLKFQAFVRLGQGDYGSHIKPYLKSDGGGNAPNRVRELDRKDLLLYNGMDAVLEHHVLGHQTKELLGG